MTCEHDTVRQVEEITLGGLTVYAVEVCDSCGSVVAEIERRPAPAEVERAVAAGAVLRV